MLEIKGLERRLKEYKGFYIEVREYLDDYTMRLNQDEISDFEARIRVLKQIYKRYVKPMYNLSRSLSTEDVANKNRESFYARDLIEKECEIGGINIHNRIRLIKEDLKHNGKEYVLRD